MSNAMSMSNPKRKTRIHNGQRYRRINPNTETNEYLKHEAMSWYPSDVWALEMFIDDEDIGGTFIVSVSEWEVGSRGVTGGGYKAGDVFKMYSHW